MQKWEYRIEILNLDDDAAVDETLRAVGARGWELVAVVASAGYEDGVRLTRFILKRPLAAEAASAAG